MLEPSIPEHLDGRLTDGSRATMGAPGHDDHASARARAASSGWADQAALVPTWAS
jgi:hypothetical protein